MGNSKKYINLVILLLIALVVLIIATSKTDDVRGQDVDEFSKVFLPLYMKQCYKKNKYSDTNPTPEQKAECEAFAKNKWEEVNVLNNTED